ncbi:MAG: ParB family protein, partial [Saezia sp.]
MPLNQVSSFLKPPKKSESGKLTEERQQDLANELLAGNFQKQGAAVSQLSDPLVDTPMVITLDQLKPYELNPRIIRNPLFEDIKDSIRERGLDAPPAITRRPGEAHYIIRNGGNTRLSILKELWAETKDERFFKIHCLFKPWVSEIVALTGHLAENELRGALTFIERALAVEKVREIYEKETDEPISQRDLSKRLRSDGYTTLTFIVRLLVLLLSVPLFVMVIFVAVIDGLVKRDLRRFIAGHES